MNPKPQPLTKVEQVALKMFEIQMQSMPKETMLTAPTKDLREFIDSAFILSYLFFDVSNTYKRTV